MRTTAGATMTARSVRGAAVTAADRSHAPSELLNRRLLERYHAHGDAAAREALAERHLPLVRHLARRYANGSEPFDDLVQVASLGLLKAIDRFDPARDVAFSSFAVPTIVGELKRYFRDKTSLVRVPRALREMTMRVQRVGDDLERQFQRAPTAAEIAGQIGATMEEVVEAHEALAARRLLSLDGSQDQEPDDRDVGELLGADDPGYRLVEDAATIDELMAVLSDRERAILRLRFHEDLTQSEIGARVGLSQMHVSRVMRAALARLQEAGDGV